MFYLSRITDATVDTFATCDFKIRMRKTAQCGPRLTMHDMDTHSLPFVKYSQFHSSSEC